MVALASLEYPWPWPHDDPAKSVALHSWYLRSIELIVTEYTPSTARSAKISVFLSVLITPSWYTSSLTAPGRVPSLSSCSWKSRLSSESASYVSGTKKSTYSLGEHDAYVGRSLTSSVMPVDATSLGTSMYSPVAQRGSSAASL